MDTTYLGLRCTCPLKSLTCDRPRCLYSQEFTIFVSPVRHDQQNLGRHKISIYFRKLVRIDFFFTRTANCKLMQFS